MSKMRSDSSAFLNAPTRSHRACQRSWRVAAMRLVSTHARSIDDSTPASRQESSGLENHHTVERRAEVRAEAVRIERDERIAPLLDGPHENRDVAPVRQRPGAE